MLLTLLLLSAAQEDLSILELEDRPKLMLQEHLLAECAKAFGARQKDIEALKTPDDVRRRQLALRSKFIEALDGLPERTPLNPRVVGTLARDGYRVERVIYESRPGHHVTANFYVPAGPGPFPGVLMPMGHSETGKAADYAQRGCILLAKNGLAALCYDPIGQGERKQLLDAKGRPAIKGSTTEHTAVGTAALLVGECTATYRIWDGLRSLDYLASRPEVDARRLGCTGCSGGGTLTSYLMALDERILAAAPSCYITTLERLFATIGPQDAEQNIPGQVAFGMDHADYVTMRAPRPTLLLTGTRDFFDIQGSWTSFREAKRIYGLLGRAEAVDLAEFDQPHGYPKTHREGAVRWMRRWLLGVDDAPVESEFAIEKEIDLHCTETGQVLSALKGVSAFDLIALRAQELAAARPKLSPDALRAKVASLLRIEDASGLMETIAGPTLKRDGYEVRKLIFIPEAGIRLPALLFLPKNRSADGVLYLHGEGKAKDAAPGGPIEALVRKGHDVLALDLRGMGETTGSEFKEAFLAQHLNRPLLAQRVKDVLRVMASPPPRIIGIGAATPVALHVALLSGATSLTLEGGISSWASVARTPLAKGQLGNVVPGVLKHYDLPDLLAAVGPVLVRNPVDPAGKPLTAAEFERDAGVHPNVEIQARTTLDLDGRKATVRRLDALPFVDSEYSKRFTFDTFENPKLKTLRESYKLDDVVAPGKDEFDRQVHLLDWAHRRFLKFGRPSSPAKGALDILKAVEEGHTFFCAHYAHVLVSASASLGWVDRALALRRHQGSAKGGSTEHTSTEIWSNQHRKWVMLDPTANLHIEKDGIPLNAIEIRTEWFTREGRDLVFSIGKERKKYRKADLPVFLARFPGFGDLTLPADELDKYGFTGFIPNTNLMDAGEDYGKMFIVQDQLCEGTKWHVRKIPANPAVDPYFPIGQAALDLKPEGAGIRVALKTLTPNLQGFRVRLDGGEWKTSDASMIWTVRKGANRLEAKTVNRFGVEGPVSIVEVDVE